MNKQDRIPRRTGAKIGLALLTILGLFYVYGAASDLISDAHGLPADHQRTFSALAGQSFDQLRAGSSGTAHYIVLLERGYALHELTFALLFLAIVWIPFRRRMQWGWWAAWLPMIANLGYTFTFGAHDPTILARSLVATIGLPVILLAHIPAFFEVAGIRNRDEGSGAGAGTEETAQGTKRERLRLKH